MKANAEDWYKRIWTLGIKSMSWVEETEKQIAFIIKTLGLTGRERILDLACGFGRHSLAFARRGYEVVGVDITEAYIADAKKEADAAGLSAEFIRSDIRDVAFEREFDVVLSMADGAIGYLESDGENLKIFDVISRALKPGGRHCMDICSAEHAEKYFPKKSWEIGEKMLSLAQFEWNPETRRMLYGGYGMPFGEKLVKPGEIAGNPTRLYSRGELRDIFHERSMEITDIFSTFDGKAFSRRELQMIVFSQKANA